MKRITIIDDVKILSVTLSSIVQFGDNRTIEAESKALAVQREAEVFYGDEGNFDAFAIFQQDIEELPYECNVQMNIQNLNPVIHVGSVEILGISSSSVFQAGSNHEIDTDARVKHIRQLLPRTP
jgi:spore germination protein PE